MFRSFVILLVVSSLIILRAPVSAAMSMSTGDLGLNPISAAQADDAVLEQPGEASVAFNSQRDELILDFDLGAAVLLVAPSWCWHGHRGSSHMLSLIHI